VSGKRKEFNTLIKRILIDVLRFYFNQKNIKFVFMNITRTIGKNLLKTALIFFVFINIVCAFHAYKLTHFYNANEVLPNPEKMSFKDKISAGVFGIKASKTASIDTFSIKHKTINLKTEDSLMLQGWYCKYENINDTNFQTKGTIILFHGHGGKKNDVIKEAYSFYNLGYNIFLVDFRAHGNSDGNVCTVGYIESKDVKAAYNYIEQKGEKNIILYGISLGAATILKAIEDDYVHPQKIIIEMPFGTLHQAVKGRLTIMNLPQEPLSSLLTFWGGIEQGFWAFNFKPQQYAQKVKCPTLLQWGKNDVRVSEIETNTIYKNIPQNNKLLIVYEQSGHQSLCKNENEKWLQNVTNFLNQ